MIAAKKRDTNLGVGIGLLLVIMGRLMQIQGAPFGFLLVLVGSGIFVWGCMSYAQGKGYSRWWGLLGLGSILGLLVLVCLPDRYQDGGPIEGWPEDRSHPAVRPY